MNDKFERSEHYTEMAAMSSMENQPLPERVSTSPEAVMPVRNDLLPERKYSFETPPEPIPSGEIKETVVTEVAVVGGGIAGVSAALSAAEAGAKTIIIEKTNRFYSWGSDIAAIDSRLQKKLGIEIDKEEVILNLMKHGGNRPDQRLIRMWAEGSGATMDWLLDMVEPTGAEVSILQFPPPAGFDNNTEYYPQYFTTHVFGMKNNVIQSMLDHAVKKGVALYPENRALQLVRTGQGRVTGVVARNAEGNYIRFDATRGVILCTGDYSNNTEMMTKYCPQCVYLPAMIKTSTGDGHQMAMWIGAVMETAPHAPIDHGHSDIGNYPFLQVNIKGERFQNEDVTGQCNTNAWERQPGKSAWQVFDSKYPDEAPKMGIGHGKWDLSGERHRQLKKNLLAADTIEELGIKMGVPVDTFGATVRRYNQLARAGRDLDFGKRADRLTTVAVPPYYACKSSYALLAVMGGLNVNARLQALDKDWEIIPGLYLAGNTVGNRFAVDYPTMVPGLSLGMALHHGRVAGKNAATLA